ncbi:hypothetical protein SAMN05428988_0235 [Chitinophaga sp. YR573]|nr:hypothetical protein SAMN05428988_0235 [Chitinophaga sp. YR573]
MPDWDFSHLTTVKKDYQTLTFLNINARLVNLLLQMAELLS